ncbi:MAG: flagellar biosynthesis protein FlhB [Clostridiales bacterium]|nr:flagellar biosynthesis protein FlhB [Clostridiales bacterium]
MFAPEGEGGEKTEPATEKKLKDARKEGKVAKSRELNSAFELVVLFLCLRIFMSFMYNNFLSVFDSVYGTMGDFVLMNEGSLSTRSFGSLGMFVLARVALIVLPFFLLGFAVTFLVCVIQVGWQISGKPLQPKGSKFNPVNGFKRIFSKDTLFELVKSIAKVAIVILVAYLSIRNDANKLFFLYEITIQQAVVLVGTIILNAGLAIAVVYIIIGFADYAYQRWKFRDDMKMTKQEVKDEYKNTEGDPQVKNRQRRKMQEVSQQRMMQSVPQADVVITNPTHLAVALQYDPEVAGSAPRVIAKGEDYVAQRIKEVARENGIKIVEDKPLARMLYTNVDLGAEIPPELYQAVAEILAVIFKERQR